MDSPIIEGMSDNSRVVSANKDGRQDNSEVVFPIREGLSDNRRAILPVKEGGMRGRIVKILVGILVMEVGGKGTICL